MARETRQRAKTLWVRTPTARYPVWVGAGLLTQSGRRIKSLRSGCRQVFVISSARVWRLWGARLTAGLRAAGIRAETLLMDDREEAKRLATVERLAEKLLERGADRGALLVAMGGGVVGDVTGFLAASYMRGVEYLQVPTTLVAQVDSAIGGKTGVNLRGGKNLLGAFHHPLAVLADVRTLDTLPEREYRAGLYEVVKCAVLGDASLSRFLERNMPAVLARRPRALRLALGGALRVKARIVGRDEHEHGKRRLLNLGHTFGHAFETLSGYRRLRHGEAVAWGLLAATRLAQRLGLLPRRDARRILCAVVSVGRLPALPQARPERVYAQLFADKKKQDSELRFVLPRRIGRAEVIESVPRRDVLAIVRELLMQ
ncbi:MAG: 3-dehydroquinate synthase [Candidatus Acidiferrales bacterium]